LEESARCNESAPLSAKVGDNVTLKISGLPSIIDGDTIHMSGRRIRLLGVDAPELRQTCGVLHGEPWRCGESSKQALRDWVADDALTCHTSSKDTYGRDLAICCKQRVDVSAWLACQGWAYAYRRYSLDYVSQEATARKARRGVWQVPFSKLPEAWRRSQRSQSTASIEPTQDCPIKGNINRRGAHLYHRPQDPSYARVIVNPRKGERIFCSEQDARAAGFKPAYP